jgi:ribosome-associated translation inhibitor RaiA
MTRPVQVTFRNMAVSTALEEVVRARAAWLESFYSGLVGCRVVLEIPHRHRMRGNPMHVRVELSLPGEDIIVSHEPTQHATLKDAQSDAVRKDAEVDGAHKDAVVAIHDAFDLARRRLEDYARRQRGDVKTRYAPS